jgi:hypothetical protein
MTTPPGPPCCPGSAPAACSSKSMKRRARTTTRSSPPRARRRRSGRWRRSRRCGAWRSWTTSGASTPAAREAFGRLVAYKPDDDGDRHRLLLWLGHCHYRLREYAEARDCYEEVLTSAWASEDERATADEWAEGSAAWLYCEAGQHAEAVTRLERLLARHPEDHPERCAALLALGTCYGALGAAGRARECRGPVLVACECGTEDRRSPAPRPPRLAPSCRSPKFPLDSRPDRILYTAHTMCSRRGA